MSFSKTISVFAALASIFSVGVASWKLSTDIKNEQTAPLEQKILQLEQQLKEQQNTTQVAPTPVILPPAQPQIQQVPAPAIFPPIQGSPQTAPPSTPEQQ